MQNVNTRNIKTDIKYRYSTLNATFRKKSAVLPPCCTNFASSNWAGCAFNGLFGFNSNGHCCSTCLMANKKSEAVLLLPSRRSDYSSWKVMEYSYNRIII